MRRWLPLLALLAGLGCSISFAQTKVQNDPFSQYLTGIKASRPEPSLVRFAQECGVDLKIVVPRYADLPDNTWILVNDLAKGIHGLETDFFVTVAVWKQGDRILVEMWEMQLDVENENRTFYCMAKRKITAEEFSDWMLPEILQNGNEKPGWGYEQHWKMTAAGKFERTFHGFVYFNGEAISEPKLDEKTRKGLNWTPKVLTWSDLKLPAALLR
jgi:hypothetical protein